MNQYKEKFSQYTDEHILSMRAMGDELSEEAHLAIEEILKERGVALSVRPSSYQLPTEDFSSDVIASARNNPQLNNFVKLIGSILVFVAGVAIAKIFVGTAVGLLLAVIAIPIWFFTRQWKTNKAAAAKVDAEEFTELMLASANGDVKEVAELVKNTSSLNLQSKSGYSALMLAVKNNNIDVARLLIEAGCDIHLRTKLGTSASDLSKKFGDDAMVRLISKSQN